MLDGRTQEARRARGAQQQPDQAGVVAELREQVADLQADLVEAREQHQKLLASRDPLMVLRVSELRQIVREDILQAHVDGLQLTKRMMSDKELADFLGYEVRTWQRMVLADPDLGSLAKIFRRQGCTRPTRRWLAWEVITYMNRLARERV